MNNEFSVLGRSVVRKDAVEKLKTIGISQATSYRYTELFEKEKKKSVIPKKDSSQKKEKNNTWIGNLKARVSKLEVWISYYC